jgi:hypothetical protein
MSQLFSLVSAQKQLLTKLTTLEIVNKFAEQMRNESNQELDPSEVLFNCVEINLSVLEEIKQLLGLITEESHK